MKKRVTRSLVPVVFKPADGGGVELIYLPARLLVDIRGPVARLEVGRLWARLFDRAHTESVRRTTFRIRMLRVSKKLWEEVTDG